MRVLLIEDDSATAQSIELMLKSESFNVYTTDLGEEGVDLGKLYDYDIILLDLNLPDMHGYDVLKKLRVAKVQTPVLILSGIAEMDSKIRSFGFGADEFHDQWRGASDAGDLFLERAKVGEADCMHTHVIVYQCMTQFSVGDHAVLELKVFSGRAIRCKYLPGRIATDFAH